MQRTVKESTKNKRIHGGSVSLFSSQMIGRCEELKKFVQSHGTERS